MATTNGAPPDVPPSAGFTTVTVAVPAAARSPVRIAAVNCVTLTYVVVRAAPFHCTRELDVKLLPVTVNVNAPESTVAVAGRIEAIAGVGLTVMVNETPVVVPPPGAGLQTVTLAVPAVARSEFKIIAVSSVELITVVALAAPFHFT